MRSRPGGGPKLPALIENAFTLGCGTAQTQHADRIEHGDIEDKKVIDDSRKTILPYPL